MLSSTHRPSCSYAVSAQSHSSSHGQVYVVALLELLSLATSHHSLRKPRRSGFAHCSIVTILSYVVARDRMGNGQQHVKGICKSIAAKRNMINTHLSGPRATDALCNGSSWSKVTPNTRGHA